MSVIEKYNKRADAVNSLVCVGLDSDFSKLPDKFKSLDNPQFEFNKWIIDQTRKYAAAYKPNIAFYESRGDQGIKELKMTMDYLRNNYPDTFTICDCKRADIGNTNNGYVESLFDWFGFDAITIHPYLGREALQPFLDRKDKGSIILCRTSNSGAGEFQDLIVDGKPIWHRVAEKVRDEWDGNNNCLLVVGATYPQEMKTIRDLVGDMTFLVPGIGAQGGDVKAVVESGLNSQKKGLIVNSSRGIIFADNPREEAKKLRDEINLYR
ncbi:MAG: orotidine-5'-phosphate decarboxylase [Parcubacteria group bacterium]|nr:orotidine-5'-phosphate decarboxylase [Parcubacteria group bacterium]